ncbi:MAG: GldG family protein [Gammaproteobacteria bacterium]|nr:GldG family protein [Gammaproteobacteria bacterium]
MQINPKVKRQLRFQNAGFVLLFLTLIGLLAWLSQRYDIQGDWSASQRNSASEATIAVLKTLSEPVTIRAFVSQANQQGRKQIQQLVNLYQRHKSDITLTFIDPVTEPAMVRELGISADGEMLIEYGQKQQKLQTVSEQDLTNNLQKLARSSDGNVLFVQGHGERQLDNKSNIDFGNFATQLKSKGVQLGSINLATSGSIPDHTLALVIADPQSGFLPGEIQLILDYVDNGGNLLWLLEPGSNNLRQLAENLGVEILPGILVDLNTQILGIRDPRFAIVAEYPMHAITQGFDTLTLFPQAAGLEFNGAEQWDAENLLVTLPRSWLENDDLSSEIRFDEGSDTQGPIVIGLALTRQIDGQNNLPQIDSEELDAPAESSDTIDPPPREQHQRIIVIGDADFLSNAYLGQAGNLQVGLNIIDWLSNDDQLISIPAKTAVDQQLNLSSVQQGIIAVSFLLLLPLGLLTVGLWLWFKRRRS